ncbi:hypothetical protein E0W68_03540 [Flavobacterium salilacus subsp. salilacus]|uniref:hypothetical protein n=1 Tax=Flavobacterium TaxID=237 RepID=UPI0010750240|nr:MULTISPECIES: hypothetical protein [Flavobacterium]KAF2519435.1 hypothetical protein E0W68_03540 [Flavobacterium salilacus subsp. salilacus]MBE1614673.1 hypothetical protein [Flavobacterium sp. SaA2.13]
MSVQPYIQFLWNSKNAHNVHSPFVYGIVTKCFHRRIPQLYTKKKNIPVKNLNLQSVNTLHKIVVGLKPAKLYVLGDKAAEITEILRISGEEANTRPWFFSTLAPIPGAIDLAYISEKDTASLLPLLEQILPNANGNTVCIVGNIHATEAMEKAWKTIKENPNVTVTVDTCHLGLIFFRQGQAKQHFIIRPFKNRVIDAVLGIRTLWGLLA